MDLHTIGQKAFTLILWKYPSILILEILAWFIRHREGERFLKLMKQKCISYWQHTLQNSQKIEFYRSFTNEYATSNYLELTRRVSDRRTLTKLRISNHKLIIELADITIRPETIGIAQSVIGIKPKMKFIFSFIVPNTQQ